MLVSRKDMIICSWRVISYRGYLTLPWHCSYPLTWSWQTRISCKFIKISCLPCCLSGMRKGTRRGPQTPAASSAFLLVHILSLCFEAIALPPAFSSIGVCPASTGRVSKVTLSACLFLPGASLCLCVWIPLCVCASRVSMCEKSLCVCEAA